MIDENLSKWFVSLSSKARKQTDELPLHIQRSLRALMSDLAVVGPSVKGWPNFGRLQNKPGEYYHCHLNKQRPRYVAVWRIEKDKIHFIGVRYVGNHEGVNYKKIS